MSKPILYTIGCPACKVLEKRMAMQGVDFETVEVTADNNPKGLQTFPQLETDSGMLSYTDAIKWLNEQSNK